MNLIEQKQSNKMKRICKITTKLLISHTILVTIFILHLCKSIEASSSFEVGSETQNSNKIYPRNSRINVRDIKPEPVKSINFNQVESVQNKHILDRPRRQSGTTEKHFGPKLIHQPQSVLVPPHKPHTVECPVESNPTAEVKWFKDDQLLMSQPTHLEQTGTELMFFQMNDEDSGQYHCEATNYLGSISSEPFKLTVQSSVQDPRVHLEPRLAVAEVEQQVEFTCSFQKSSSRISTRQRRGKSPEVGWRRNGRKLVVKWLTSDQDSDGQAVAGSEVRSRYVAKHVTNTLSAHNTMVFTLTIMKTQLKDDNATFSCLVGASLIDGEEVNSEELARESNQIKLRVYSKEQQQRQNLGVTAIVNMNSSLAPPLEDLLSRDIQHLNPDITKQRDLYLAQQNFTTQLSPDPFSSSQTPTRRVSTLWGTLLDLYEISKPTLLGFTILLLISIIILLQWIYIRRKNRLENRYIKHHTYSNSSGSGGSGTSSAINAIDFGDSHIDSLIHRTISAQSAMSLSGNNNGALTGGKKYRSYRDQLRKVAAVNDNATDLVGVAGIGSDLVNVNGYLLAAASQSKQNSNNNNNCQANKNNEPFFISSELPNLYNQSLAAREQARSLLQASEHMRSLGNLPIAGQKQQHKFHHQVASALQRFNGANQNGSHLNLPLSFAFKDETESQSSSMATNNARSNNDQHLHNRPLEGPSQLIASALWQPQVNQQFRHLKQQQQQQQHFNHQIYGQQMSENYQLVNCSSVSPCSSSSASSSKSSQGNNIVQSNRPLDLNRVRLQHGNTNHQGQIEESNTSLNHYSTIEMNDDDESRYEEVDDGGQNLVTNKRSSVHLKSSDKHQLFHHQDNLKISKTSTFVRDNSIRSEQSNQISLRSSLMSNSSTSGCDDLKTITNSTINSATDVNPSNNRFNQGKDKRQHQMQQQDMKHPTSNQMDKSNRLKYQDQLSPYAVSSICSSISTNQQPPPPVNSEAMRALNEQFDINHLLLNEPAEGNSSPAPFDSISLTLPPPPPPPSQTGQ